MQPVRLAQYRSNLLDAVQIGAVGLAALALAPTVAHVFALPARLQLSPSEYLVEQQAHEGLVLFAVIGCLALAAVGAHTFMVRRNATAYGWSLVAVVALGAAQIVMWSIAYPVGVETGGWTTLPVDFAAARTRWEYAFVLAGILSFSALLAFVRAIEASRPIASMAILASIEHDAAVRAARMRARPLDGEENGPSPMRGVTEKTRAA
jgi:hypothetical protein